MSAGQRAPATIIRYPETFDFDIQITDSIVAGVDTEGRSLKLNPTKQASR